MQITEPLKYLFWVVFRWHVETNSTRHPTIVPTVVVTILLSLNIVVAIQLFVFFRGNIPTLNLYRPLFRLVGYILFAIVGGIVWLLFVRNGAYRQFDAEFSKASTARRRLRTAGVYLYVIISLCLPFVVKAYLHNARTA